MESFALHICREIWNCVTYKYAEAIFFIGTFSLAGPSGTSCPDRDGPGDLEPEVVCKHCHQGDCEKGRNVSVHVGSGGSDGGTWFCVALCDSGELKRFPPSCL